MVVESILRSVAMSRDMERRHYTRVFEILDREIKPWLRYLDANAQDKFLTQVFSDMGKCALSIIREAERFNEIYVHSFCISALKKYSVFPLPKCHFYKVTCHNFTSPSVCVSFSLVNCSVLYSVLPAGAFFTVSVQGDKQITNR
ncbi:PREDICTED: separase [Camelina sativa]|uniref:Separase n=1 Tax=Camelina sativa TaxID=90675 RepID=A0ABM1QMP2_CAMSA|nr:PREDICTED: separase [Camelina sativa]